MPPLARKLARLDWLAPDDPRQGGRSGIALKSSPSQPLILVDGMNLVFRSHFAHPHLLSANGEPTSVYYGFLNAILRLLGQTRRLVVCWEGRANRNWRLAIYPQYKANRTKNPAMAIALSQLPALMKVLDLIAVPSLEIAGLEADDLIGILSRLYRGQVWIYSGDKDLHQLLVAGRVHILNPKGRPFPDLLEEDDLELTPDQWPIHLALAGDSSDGVKVLPNVGAVKAKKLIGMGVHPDLPFKRQPKEFQQSYPGYKDLWPQVQAAYKAMKIPTSLGDPRIEALTNHLPETDIIKFFEPRSMRSREKRMQAFTQFCAEFDLRELIARRREFFQ